jgi:hypothetical protein
MQNVTWSPGAELVRHEDVIVCVAANQYRDAESTVTIQLELYCHFLNKGLILVPFTLFMKDGVSIIVDVFLSVLFLFHVLSPPFVSFTLDCRFPRTHHET